MNRLAMLSAVILLTGCSGMQKKELPLTAESRLQSDSEVLEKAGLKLEETVIEMPAFRVTSVSTSARFTEIKSVMPGDDMRDVYRPGELSAGDWLVGVNNALVTEDSKKDMSGFYENKFLSAYASKQSLIPLQFLDTRTGEVKTLLSNDKHSLGDYKLEPGYVHMKGTMISAVRPGSWADKHKLSAGDLLIGQVRLQAVTLRRSWMKFAPHKRLIHPLEVTESSEILQVSRLLASMFREVRAYRPASSDKDGVMGHGTLASLSTVKDRKVILPLSLANTRYVGLGLQFDCSPYCGNAKPVIKAMFPQSSGARAGFQLEDLALEVNGKKVHSSWQAVQIIRRIDYGETLTIKVRRGNEIHSIDVKVDWVYED